MKKILTISIILGSITTNIASMVYGPKNFEIYNKSQYNITKIEIMQPLSVVQQQRKQNFFEQFGNLLSKPSDLVTVLKSDDKRPIMPMQFFEAGLPIGKDSFVITIVWKNRSFNYEIQPCVDGKCATQIFLTFNPDDAQRRPALRPQTGKLGGYPQIFGFAGMTESGKKIINNVEQRNISATIVRR